MGSESGLLVLALIDCAEAIELQPKHRKIKEDIEVSLSKATVITFHLN